MIHPDTSLGMKARTSSPLPGGISTIRMSVSQSTVSSIWSMVKCFLCSTIRTGISSSLNFRERKESPISCTPFQRRGEMSLPTLICSGSARVISARQGFSRSQSSTPTLVPSRARARAVPRATVDFPTPPLPDRTRINFGVPIPAPSSAPLPWPSQGWRPLGPFPAPPRGTCLSSPPRPPPSSGPPPPAGESQVSCPP